MSQLVEARRRRILALLQEQPVLTLRELADRLDVSAMTVHRDLSRLAADGELVRTRGSVAAAPLPVGQQVSTPDRCALCGRTVPERTAFVIQAGARGNLSACCAHCGLSLLSREPAGEMALVADFLYGRMVGAARATYVVDSTVTSCCAPGMLAFADAEDAGRFQMSFGGKAMDMAGAQAYLKCHVADCAGH
jgi:nitrous oxide reductase accessory protein NosL